MAVNSEFITREDIARLSSDNSPKVRAKVADKLSAQFADKTTRRFTNAQMEIVEQIFRALIKDAAIEVRKVLSENLSQASDLPSDIAKSIAMDLDKEVSLPMIEFSSVLSDEDLVEIIRTSEDVAKKKAVASRDNISEAVTDALVETKNAEVVTTLMMNDKAKISEQTFTKAVDYFANNSEVVESIITNGGLPPSITDYITEKVSQKIQQEIGSKYNTHFANINTFFSRARDVVGMKLMGVQFHDIEMGRIVRGMQKDGSLTPLSGLCMGSPQIFYATVARQAKISIANVRLLIHDQGELGVPALLKASKISERFSTAVRVMIAVLAQLENENIIFTKDQKKFAELYISRLKYVTHGTRIEGLDFLIGLIRHYADDKPAVPQGDF